MKTNYWVHFVHLLLLSENDEDFQEAINELEKQKKNQMLLIATELRMRIENANNLALFEETRINKFYEVFSGVGSEN